MPSRPASTTKRPPALPSLLDRKIYKTGQTRGADDDVIYQNRVSRSSTVLIPYAFWGTPTLFPNITKEFENGYIVLIPPQVYFSRAGIDSVLRSQELELGKNCVVFYETRADWDGYNPVKMGKRGWKTAGNRQHPVGGQYVARVPATTASSGGGKIIEGFTTTSSKGAGIRLYEYADSVATAKCRLQLETLYWTCDDALAAVIEGGMSKQDAILRRDTRLKECQQAGLLDLRQLRSIRVIDGDNKTICPLCLEPLPAHGFFSRLAQAEGREVPDLTVTEINLFHIEELKYAAFNHRPYNVGWGHHHCNVVTRDRGIMPTLKWMRDVLKRNDESGRKVLTPD